MRPTARGCVGLPKAWPTSISPRNRSSSWPKSGLFCARLRSRLSLRATREVPMIAVIFEVWPKPELRQQYFDLAAELRPILETIDGFISVERFESLTEKGKFLSISFFRNEAAVEAWRNVVEHRRSQAK